MDIIILFLLALFGSILALAGGVFFLYNKRFFKILEANSVPFAAGVMITVSLMGILPESIELSGEVVFTVVVIAFFTAYLFEHFFFGIHHHADDKHGRNYESSVPLVLIGDTIHNFIDGLAIGASFIISPGLGFITALSTFLHEIPHEVGDFGILLKAGWEKRKIVLINAISASMTIVGAFTVCILPKNDYLVGVILAVSAGIFLYLGASDFLPTIDKEKSKFNTILPLLLGVSIIFVTLLLVPHSHE